MRREAKNCIFYLDKGARFLPPLCDCYEHSALYCEGVCKHYEEKESEEVDSNIEL